MTAPSSTLRQAQGRLTVWSASLRWGPGTTTHYYLPDGLGSTMALVNASGTVVNTYNYDVFGAVRSSTGTLANEFQFTGEQVDANTGFEYLRARYHDQVTGRFLSRDRVAPNVRDGQSLNPFAYVRNNPAVFVDPSGLWCPKNPKDCIPNRETLSRLQKPTVLTLDVLAIGFQGASAVITDAATVAGCVAGPPAGPGGVLAGCMAGYLLGRSATTGFRIAGNVASATSTAIGCIPLEEKPPDKETKSPNFAKECGFSLANTVISAIIQDPNVGLAADIYQFCRDLGKCGP